MMSRRFDEFQKSGHLLPLKSGLSVIIHVDQNRLHGVQGSSTRQLGLAIYGFFKDSLDYRPCRVLELVSFQ
jgi:hypothetical protein